MKEVELKEGELHIGTITKPDGTGYQLILLPSDQDGASYAEQMKWAESIGGDLPDRVELAFMYKYLKDQFKPTVYWSNEADGTEWAWYQGFYNGNQTNGIKNYKLRARAVRRVSVI